MRINQDMRISSEDTKQFKAAKCCYICNGDFTEKNYKVRDHDHRTGRYRGAAHTRCNINHYSNRYLPIFFHNLKGYDSHHILRAAIDIVKRKDTIKAIPQSVEKFMTFSIGDLKFCDSAQFMPDSLETLAENLKTTNQDRYQNFNCMKQNFNQEEMELICQKGVYPYEYIDDVEKFKDTELPPIKAFYSKLRLSGISQESYKHAKKRI
jgi:hypothetical protein